MILEWCLDESLTKNNFMRTDILTIAITSIIFCHHYHYHLDYCWCCLGFFHHCGSCHCYVFVRPSFFAAIVAVTTSVAMLVVEFWIKDRLWSQRSQWPLSFATIIIFNIILSPSWKLIMSIDCSFLQHHVQPVIVAWFLPLLEEWDIQDVEKWYSTSRILRTDEPFALSGVWGCTLSQWIQNIKWMSYVRNIQSWNDSDVWMITSTNEHEWIIHMPIIRRVS